MNMEFHRSPELQRKRLLRLALQLLGRPGRAKPLGGVLRSRACSAAAEPTTERPVTSHTGVKVYASGAFEWPVVDPFGRFCTLEDYKAVRSKEHAASQAYMEKVKNREVPPPSDAIAYQYFGEGQWPYHDGSSFVGDPYVMSPEANEIFRPILRRMVADLRDHGGTYSTLAKEPKVINGWEAYVEPTRFEVEKKYMFQQHVLLAGLSNDLGLRPHDYMRWDGEGTLGIQVLLYRDKDGRFRAFENFGLRNNLALVSTEEPLKGNKDLHLDDALQEQLVELPSLEKSGMLWVIPHVPEGGEAEAKRMMDEVMPEDLCREFDAMRVDLHHCVASQTLKVDCNWKLLVDTFGEHYHLAALHPILGKIAVTNLSDYRTYGQGPEVRGGSPGGVWHGCVSNTKFTARVMAKGEVPEDRWDEPSVNSHCIHLYNLAPNVCFLVRPDGFLMNICYPGSHPGETIFVISQYVAHPPKTLKDLEKGLKVWKVAVDIFAFEDFWCCVRIQKNVETNPHAELVFGRNEPGLVDRHNYYERSIAGRHH